jgi:PAS domain S-box-containing protein
LSRAERALPRVFEAAGDAAILLDPLADRFVAANAAGCSLLGYPLEELLETPVSGIHPGELTQLQELVGRVLRTGHDTTILLTCRTRAGTYLPVEMSLTRVDRGDRAYLLGLVRDRSEHRHRPLR